MKLNNWVIVPLKIYTVAALIAAAIVSTPMTAFIPVLLVVIYLVLWRWPIRYQYRLLADYFIFLSISILMASTLGPYLSAIIALPVLVPLTKSLAEMAEVVSHNRATGHIRYPTRLCLGLFIIAILTLIVAFWIDNLALILSSAIVIAFFCTLVVIILRNLPIKPIDEEQVSLKLLAGMRTKINIRLKPGTRFGGMLFLKPLDEWVQVSPLGISLKEGEIGVEASLTPPLSGSTIIQFESYVIDRWGLMQTKFMLEPIKLTVIPRAKYAAWLIQKYLTGTRPGILPLASEFEVLKPTYGLRRGVEYYGSRLYQPGDSLKSIDWKHSAKFNELISKEFVEFHGQPVAILTNLMVGNAEEADDLAYKIMVTALSLAQENIPAALAAYDKDAVIVITSLLTPQQLVQQALDIADKIVTTATPLRYIKPPNVIRLKANLTRLGNAENKAAQALRGLLQMEYMNLISLAKQSPISRAIAAILRRVGQQASIMVISQQNHDAEALAIQTFFLAAQGNAIINV